VSNHLWSETFRGTYTAEVIRMASGGGLLTVFRIQPNRLIHEVTVTLSFDESFGPDVADYQSWEDIALTAIEEDDSKSL